MGASIAPLGSGGAAVALVVAGLPLVLLLAIGTAFRAALPLATNLALSGSRVVPAVLLLAGASVAAWRVAKELGLRVA